MGKVVVAMVLAIHSLLVDKLFCSLFCFFHCLHVVPDSLFLKEIKKITPFIISEDVRSPVPGVIGSCESLYMGAGNQLRVLQKMGTLPEWSCVLMLPVL